MACRCAGGCRARLKGAALYGASGARVTCHTVSPRNVARRVTRQTYGKVNELACGALSAQQRRSCSVRNFSIAGWRLGSGRRRGCGGVSGSTRRPCTSGGPLAEGRRRLEAARGGRRLRRLRRELQRVGFVWRAQVVGNTDGRDRPRPRVAFGLLAIQCASVFPGACGQKASDERKRQVGAA
jgi:hypothetical protein